MAKVNQKVADARIQPHNLESEQCVLGCAIINNDAAFSIMSELKESDFYSETHKLIFDAMFKQIFFSVSGLVCPKIFLTGRDKIDDNLCLNLQSSRTCINPIQTA